MKKYDVFISYRRDGGAETAKHIRDSLVEKGYKVFYDLESLRAGNFNTKLLEVIEHSTDMLLILPPGGLDRCESEDDWVRKEVEHALKKKINIIPVMLNGFEFPQTLPPSIDGIRYLNGLCANIEFYDAFIEKLASFLHSSKKLSRKRIMLITCLMAVAVCAGLFFLSFEKKPEKIKPFGSVSGETYTNKMLGISSSWDQEIWAIQTRDQINAIMGNTNEVLTMTSEELASTEGGYMDFIVLSNDSTANLNFLIQTVSIQESGSLQTAHDETMSKIYDEIADMTMKSYAYMGYENFKSDIGSITYKNEAYSTLRISCSYNGGIMHQQILSFSDGDYLFTLTATTFGNDYTQTILSRFLGK